jgi:hypothetical protein
MKTSSLALCSLVAAGLSGSLAGCVSKQNVDFSSLAESGKRPSASLIQVVGTVGYGDPNQVTYHAPPEFVGLTFGGAAGDVLDLEVTSQNGDPYVGVLDADFELLASSDEQSPGKNLQTLTLPADGEYTIAIADDYATDAVYVVSLKRHVDPMYACGADSDCVAIARAGCCPDGTLVAVNAKHVDSYNDHNVCENPGMICSHHVIVDNRVAECNLGSGACELVKPADIRCGGFTSNPHACPDGYQCHLNNIPDVPGSCVSTEGVQLNKPCVQVELCVNGYVFSRDVCQCVPASN